MKTVLLSDPERTYKLCIAQPGAKDDELPVLAVMELYEGLGAWSIGDLRLHPHALASPYFAIGASHMTASCKAETLEAATLVRSLLSDLTEAPNPDGSVDFSWCDFHGIVKGSKLSELIGAGSWDAWAGTKPVYHSEDAAKAYLWAAAAFWERLDIDAADSQAAELAKRVKIENQHLQLSESAIGFRLAALDIESHETRAEASMERGG